MITCTAHFLCMVPISLTTDFVHDLHYSRCSGSVLAAAALFTVDSVCVWRAVQWCPDWVESKTCYSKRRSGHGRHRLAPPTSRFLRLVGVGFCFKCGGIPIFSMSGMFAFRGSGRSSARRCWRIVLYRPCLKYYNRYSLKSMVTGTG